MEAIKRATTRADRGAHRNVIAMPASELPTKWHIVVPELRALPEVQQ